MISTEAEILGEENIWLMKLEKINFLYIEMHKVT